MDSFELSSDTYDPSVLRERRRQPNETDVSSRENQPEHPAKNITGKATGHQESSNHKSSVTPQTKTRAPKSEQPPGNPFAFLSDRRFKIFTGVLLILAACYMLIASLSFLSSGAEDQSLISSGPITKAAIRASEVDNAAGLLGAYLSNLIVSKWFGLGAFVLIFYIGALGIHLVGMHKFRFWKLTFRCLLMTVAISVLSGFVTYNSGGFHFWGGEHGYFVNSWLFTYTGLWGTLAVNILLVALMILIFFAQVRVIYNFIAKKISAQRQRISEMNARHIERSEERRRQQAGKESKQEHTTDSAKETSNHISTDDSSCIENRPKQPMEFEDIPKNDYENIIPESESQRDEEPDTIADHNECPADVPASIEQQGEVSITVTQPEIEKGNIEHMHIGTDYDHTAELSRYRFPSLELLTERTASRNVVDLEEQESNKERITHTLNSYGVEIASIKATVGPTITLYEIVPAEGVRISKIKHLGDDMALNLAALGIRIIAPMPGRGTIGMEVPNRDPQIVSIRSILSSKAYMETKAALPLAMGTTIQNEVYIADLAKIPHLLVAGATGMGKSVGLNAIIASLLYKKHPSELKFVLIDPKMVEFSLYSKLERHYLAKLPDEEEAIITEPEKAVITLQSLCVEMQNRLALLRKAGMRNISEYNALFTQRQLNPEKGHRFLPYIVVIIDEFADLLMTTGKELETPVARLAQKARAVGIHLILATQRPSVDVITGMIKNNFPGRVAFRVTQAVDSRTILDRPGAEQLVGRGDMLFSQDGKTQRVQCALIETSEVEAICNSIAEQVGYGAAYELPDYVPTSESGNGNIGAVTDRDPLFEDAGHTIIESGTGSTSLLQRKYNIGYPRAGKIMDQLEMAGVVGPAQGGKPRQVLMDIMSFEAMLQ